MPNNDLISRKALLENYDLKNATKYGNKTQEQQHNSYSTLMLYEITDMIMDAPAVDAEPVRYGTWIKKIGCCKCSECLTECWADSVLGYDFCPNCGAKMEKEE